MQKIIFLDRSTFDSSLELPAPAIEHQWVNFEATAPEQIVERLIDADVAVTNKVLLDKQVLSQLPKLKHIAITATGINNVDLDYCNKNNITVSNAKGYGAISVAEHGMLLLLALRRNLPSYLKDVASGKWETSDQFCYYEAPLSDLQGTTLALIGQGDIGRVLAARAESFGIKVLCVERKKALDIRDGYTEFDDAITRSDHFIITCPLTEETRNLIGQREFSLMKKTAVVINLARGGIVNEADLVDAIDQQKIIGAATDVAEHEPLRRDSPLGYLKNRDNVIITPHIAWASIGAQKKLLEMVMDNIERNSPP